MTKKIRTLDLFHGLGGCSSGAKLAGAEIVAGIDFWNISSDAYKCNFPSATVINQDIRAVSPVTLKKQIGNIDLIVASPECTNHSCAKGSNPICEESRETAFEIIKFANTFRPRWIVIENVIQMRSWHGHQRLLEELWELGYFIKEQVLNAQDFKVPQSRKRLFLLCSLSGESEAIKINRKHLNSAQEIIDKSSLYKFTELNKPGRAINTLERAKRAVSQIGNNEPFLVVYYGTDGAGGWQTIDKPLRTITTLDRFAYVKPTNSGHLMRMLQPEELKLAMGFPSKYKLATKNRRDKIKLIGNAVCPPVMKEIVSSLINN